MRSRSEDTGDGYFQVFRRARRIRTWKLCFNPRDRSLLSQPLHHVLPAFVEKMKAVSSGSAHLRGVSLVLLAGHEQGVLGFHFACGDEAILLGGAVVPFDGGLFAEDHSTADVIR